MDITHPSLGRIDFAIVVAYLILIMVPAFIGNFMKKQDASEYLVARKSANWFVVAVSVFATLFSTISFVSSPGEGYGFGMMYFYVAVLQLVFVPLSIWLFLRFFFKAATFTAYEYLEQRFDRKNRVLGSSIFLLIRLLYTACVFYSASVIFESMTGWNPQVTVLVIGIVTIAYAFIGGAKAIMSAGVIQSIIIALGIIAILVGVLIAIDFDIKGMFSYAHAHDHLGEHIFTKEFYGFNVKERFNFYLLLFVIIIPPLQNTSCDQMVIQRLLAGKNFKEAKHSVYMSNFISLPVSFMLFGLGVCLFYFYTSGKFAAAEGVKVTADSALATFVLTKLPTPFPGLIVIALLAAMMSTIAGAINSLTAVLFKDILPTITQSVTKEETEVKWCKILTLFFGFLTICMALALFKMGDGLKTTVMEVVSVCSALWPTLFSAFLFGVLTKRVSATAMFVSMVLSGLVNIICPVVLYYMLPEENRWSFQWVSLPGIIASLVLPPLLSLVWPNRKDVNGLTIYTLKEADIKG